MTHKKNLGQKRTYLAILIMATCTALIMFVTGTQVETAHEQDMALDSIVEPIPIPVEDTLRLTHEEKIKFSDIPYANYFKQFAPRVNWPWELFASVAYHESRFNPNTISPSGARGLMQLMPARCEDYGLNDSTSFVPKDNIEASTKLIRALQHRYKMVTDSAEQIKFVLAAYNIGSAHIIDAQSLAERYGDNPCIWEDAEYYLENLNQPEFYNDSVVLYGSFAHKKATKAIKYVHNVLHTYHQIKAANNPNHQHPVSSQLEP